jgi:hypothetical protein
MHPGARCHDAHEVVFPPVPHGEHGRAVLHGSCRHSLYVRATLMGTEPICGVAVSASVLKNGNAHPRSPRNHGRLLTYTRCIPALIKSFMTSY